MPLPRSGDNRSSWYQRRPLAWPHKDPSTSMLIAQAQSENLAIVSDNTVSIVMVRRLW
jgi:PIN domain nuclease of toxin-antitoxin system